MNYRTHAAFGAAFTAGLLLVLKQPLMPISVALGTFTAILPDMDIEGSKASRLLWPIAFLGRLIYTILSLVFNAFVGLIGLFGIRLADANADHRGPFSHSPVGMAIFAIAFLPILFFGSQWWYVAALTGIFSHLVADSLNPSGILWLWPLPHTGPISFLPHALAIPTKTPPDIREELTFFLVMASFLAVVLASAYGPGVSLQDAAKLWSPAASLRFTMGTTAAKDASLPVGELPKGILRMPDGKLYFTDGTPVSVQELANRNIKMPAGWDPNSISAQGQQALDGFKPVVDLLNRGLNPKP